uniref:Crustacean cardioactive peptide n=1 Tax=Timema cristinae TaxID=61476 RepID=A0A7R9DA72_TIMCR|nr:unnamed protein product [Timema cristinae]
MQLLHMVIAGTVVVLLATLGLPLAQADDVIMQKREVDPADMERLLDPKRKRPFCNAFTGCGKKRSDESMGTLVDLNSEPAVEELSRQILSEAKLWEAIQEARIELLRRRQEQVSSTVPALDSKLLLILGEQDEEGLYCQYLLAGSLLYILGEQDEEGLYCQHLLAGSLLYILGEQDDEGLYCQYLLAGSLLYILGEQDEEGGYCQHLLAGSLLYILGEQDEEGGYCQYLLAGSLLYILGDQDEEGLPALACRELTIHTRGAG